MKKPIYRLLFIIVLLIVFAVVLSTVQETRMISKYVGLHDQWVDWGLCLLWCILGILFIHNSTRTVQHVLGRRESHGKVSILVSRLYSAIGYVFVCVVALHLLHVKVGSILVGGALTGVIVGIGAQSTLANFFAGVMLFTLRPFTIGQTITVRTYLFSGIEYSGVVETINWYHTILLDGGQRRVIPNSSIIVSAITIVSDENTRVFTVPVPYGVSVHELEDQINQVSDGKVRVSIVNFCENTYNAEIKLPVQVDADLIRSVVFKAVHLDDPQ